MTPEGWTEVDKALERTFEFDDFVGSLAFVNRVGELAESENHHPDIAISLQQGDAALVDAHRRRHHRPRPRAGREVGWALAQERNPRTRSSVRATIPEARRFAARSSLRSVGRGFDHDHGHAAWVTTCRLTEPRSAALRPLRPWDPTTTSWADSLSQRGRRLRPPRRASARPLSLRPLRRSRARRRAHSAPRPARLRADRERHRRARRRARGRRAAATECTTTRAARRAAWRADALPRLPSAAPHSTRPTRRFRPRSRSLRASLAASKVAAVMTAPRVTLYEVGPRDGLQNEPEILDVETRAELVRRLVGTGLPAVEVASFVDPRRVPQMAHAEEVVEAVGAASGHDPRRARAERAGVRPSCSAPDSTRSGSRSV